METIELFFNNVIGYYRKIFTDSIEIILLYFCIPVIVMMAELAVVGWQDSSIRKLLRLSPSTKNDVVSFILFNTKLCQILGYGMLLGLAVFLPSKLRLLFGYNLIHSIPNVYMQALIVFIVADFLDYWIHRMEHRFQPLWYLHKYHHSCTEFSVLTAHRSHPLSEISIKKIVKAIPMAIIGVPMESFLLIVIATRTLSFLHHSQLVWNFGWLGKYIFISPAIHRIHHSVELKHHDKNYGGFLVFWDKLFGTWHQADAINIPEIGVEDNDLNHPNYFLNVYRAYKAFLMWVGKNLNAIRLVFRTGVSLNQSEKTSGHIERNAG